MMGLKLFHLFFISLSTLLGVLVGVWGTGEFQTDGSIQGLMVGIIGYAMACVLTVYATRVLKKFRAL